MYKYISFDIENLEPLKLSQTSVQIDNEESKSFIQGSSIRGSFIANYMFLNNLKDLNDSHKKMLLKDGIEFLNAYPKRKNKRTLPFMKNLFTTKEEMKRFGDRKVMSVISPKDAKEAVQRVKGIEFASYDFKNKSIEAVKVKKISNIHINKSRSKEEKNKLFTYEAIEEKNRFDGIIKLKEEYEKEVLEVMEKGTFYLGGSKGSGYGKCKILNINVSDENPEIKYLKEQNLLEELTSEKCKDFYLLFTSDAILRNDLGLLMNSPEIDFLEKKLGLDKVVEKETFIDTDIFTGFNNKWGYRLPIINGIKLGSLIKYEFKGKFDKEKVKSFIEEGIGERKQEGFGRILLIPDVKFNEILKEESKNVLKEEIKFTNEDKEQLELISKRIYLNKVNSTIPKIVLNLEINDKGCELNNSQWGKLVELMRLLEGKNEKESIQFIEKYFANIKGKKLNRSLSNKISKIKIEEKELENFIKEFVTISKEEFYKKYCNKVTVGGVASDIPISEFTRIKVNILKGMFQLKLKKERK